MVAAKPLEVDEATAAVATRTHLQLEALLVTHFMIMDTFAA